MNNGDAPFKLALVKATHDKLPISIRSHFASDENLDLAPLHMPDMSVLRERAKQLFLMFGTTPGLVTRPLTDAEKQKLTPFEIATYNLWLQAAEDGCPFEITKYINDMVIGPPTQKIESKSVTGNVKDWNEMLLENKDAINADIQRAREAEAKAKLEKQETEHQVVDITVSETQT